MSELERLMAELCLPTRNMRWNAKENESFLYIDLSSVDRFEHRIIEVQTINSSNAPSRAQQIVELNDVIFATTRPTLQRFCSIPEEFDGQICSTGFCVLRPNLEVVIPRYVYHHIGTSRFQSYVEALQKGASYPAITNSEVKAFRIPLPPVPVQREIVRILDDFSKHSVALMAELNAELITRQKQYEFYRDMLLTFNRPENIILTDGQASRFNG